MPTQFLCNQATSPNQHTPDNAQMLSGSNSMRNCTGSTKHVHHIVNAGIGTGKSLSPPPIQKGKGKYLKDALINEAMIPYLPLTRNGNLPFRVERVEPRKF